jgi:pilus assembly protein CpaB
MVVIRFVLFTLLAGSIAAIGFFAWIASRGPETAAEAPAKVTILVASRTLRVGSLVKPEDLSAKEIPATEVTDHEQRDTAATRGPWVGAVGRLPVEAEQPIAPDAVLRPGDYGFLAAVLTPGMRASTIAIDAVSGSAGLIWPGDHVDVILTQLLEAPNLPPGHKVSAETLLSDVRVIAIDQQLTQGATSAAAGQSVRTATLEVTPEQAEKIAVATRLGLLSLDLRPAGAVAPIAQGAAQGAKPAEEPAPVVASVPAPPISPTLASPASATPSAPSASATASAPSATAAPSAPSSTATTRSEPAPASVPPGPPPVPSSAGGSGTAAAPATAGALGTGAPGTSAEAGTAGQHAVIWGSDVSAAIGSGNSAPTAPHPSMRIYSGAGQGEEVHF